MIDRLEWKLEDEWFRASEVDPKSGVITEWKKNPESRSVIKKNISSDKKLTRVVADFGESKGLNYHRLYSKDQTPQLKAELGNQGVDLSATSQNYSVYCSYNLSGSLRDVSLEISPDDVLDLPDIEERPLKDKLEELFGLYTFEGDKVLYPLCNTFDEVWDNEDETKMLMDALREKGFGEEDKVAILGTAAVAAHLLVQDLLEDRVKAIDDQVTNSIITSLTLESARIILSEIKSPSQAQADHYLLAFNEALNTKLLLYYACREAKGVWKLALNYDPERRSFTATDGQEVLLDGTLNRQEVYQYSLNHEDGLIALSVKHLFGKGALPKALIYDQVNFEQFQSAITVPENTGWENAAEIFNTLKVTV